MTTSGTFNDDVVVGGDLRLTGVVTPKKDRDEILSIEEKIATIQWASLRVFDAFQTTLPGTAATDDLALIGGGFGTGTPSVQSVDFGGTTTTAYARLSIPLPANYVAGQSVKIRFHGGMLVVADTSCTLDCECYLSNEEAGKTGSDLASAAVANNINSATFVDVDFTITASTLEPGDLLDVRFSVTGTDAGNAAPNITAVIGAIKLVYNGR